MGEPLIPITTNRTYGEGEIVGYWLRLLSLTLSRALGGLVAQLRRPVPRLILSLVGTALAVAAAGWLWALKAGNGSARSWLSPWNVLSIWAFTVLAWSIWRARRQLVIGRFEDFSDKTAGLNAAGFGALVATQLAMLNDLFRGFDEGRQFQATRDSIAPLNAAFQADGASQSLDTAVSSESSFALGPIKLPVGFIIGLIGRLVKGPTLSGHIHRDGAARVITVRLAGSLGDRSWVIAESVQHDAKGAELWTPAREVANGVAHRVFTELSIGPTVRWEALAKFGDGVRAYRNSLRIARERLLNLRTAERCLIAAQGEDENFDLAYYNLGIVYTELAGLNRARREGVPAAYGGMLDAAVSAFEKAREKGPNRWCTQYALAHTSLQQAAHAFDGNRPQAALLHLATTSDYCNAALRCAPDNAARAQTISVRCAVHWGRGWRLNPQEPQLSELQQAGTLARRGARVAWRALCAAQWSPTPRREELGSRAARSAVIATRSLRDLAQLQQTAVDGLDREAAGVRAGGKRPSRTSRYMRWTLAGRATGCLKLARSLSPNDASIRMELGTALRQRGKWHAAAKAFRTATQLDPNIPEAWGALALALAQLDDRQGAQDAAMRLFGLGHVASLDSIRWLLEANTAQLRLFEEIGALAATRAASTGAAATARLLIRFFRLGWRLGERRFVGLGPATLKLASLAKDPAGLEPYRADLTRIAERAKALFSVRQQVPELKALGKDGIEKLATLLKEQREANRPWEFGDVGYALGNAYLQDEQLDKAYAVFREMIEVLGSSLGSEIKRRGLHVMLSRILRAQGKPAEALLEARHAIDRDPLNDFERTELGYTYLDLAEYADAQQAFEDALKFAPNRPDLHMYAARTHLSQLDQCRTKEARAARLDSARQELTVALDLYDQDNVQRLSARYDLASVQQYLCNWPEALRELRALERVGYCPLTVRLEIADVLLSTRDWVAAENGFRALAVELDALMVEKGVNHVPERPWNSTHVVGTASAWAHLGISAALAGREIQLTDALAEVAKARASLEGVSDASGPATMSGGCDYMEGEILLTQDKAELAIAKLELALGRVGNSNQYLALAKALTRRVEIAGKGPQQAPTLRRAAAYLAESERLDFANESSIELTRLQSRLQVLTS